MLRYFRDLIPVVQQQNRAALLGRSGSIYIIRQIGGRINFDIVLGIDSFAGHRRAQICHEPLIPVIHGDVLEQFAVNEPAAQIGQYAVVFLHPLHQRHLNEGLVQQQIILDGQPARQQPGEGIDHKAKGKPLLVQVTRPLKNFSQNDFRAARHRMKIHLPIHLIPGHQIVLDGMHAAFLDHDMAPVGTKHAQNPVQIEGAAVDSGEIGVPQQVVHPVGVHLARDQTDHDFMPVSPVDHLGHLLRKISGHGRQHAVHFRILQHNSTRPFLMEGKEHALEGMGERPVPDIVQQGGAQAQQFLLRGPVLKMMALKLGYNFTGNFIHSERMGKPAVLRAVKSIERRAQLADSAQPLKFLRIDQVPNRLILNINIFMNRIFKYLFFLQPSIHDKHSLPIIRHFPSFFDILLYFLSKIRSALIPNFIIYTLILRWFAPFFSRKKRDFMYDDISRKWLKTVFHQSFRGFSFPPVLPIYFIIKIWHTTAGKFILTYLGKVGMMEIENIVENWR